MNSPRAALSSEPFPPLLLINREIIWTTRQPKAYIFALYQRDSFAIASISLYRRFYCDFFSISFFLLFSPNENCAKQSRATNEPCSSGGSRSLKSATLDRKIDAQASLSPLLTLNYSTTRRPGEDFIKIARIVIAVVQSQRTGEREGEKERADGGERERPGTGPTTFTQRYLS